MGDLPEPGLQRGLRLATVAIALVHLFALNLPPLLANASVYRSYPVEIIAFLLVAFVLVSVGHAVWRGRAFNRTLLSGVLFAVMDRLTAGKSGGH